MPLFGGPATVRIRFINRHIADHKFLPANLAGALAEIYGREQPDADTLDAGKGIQLYEQWVSLETPAALVRQRIQRTVCTPFIVDSRFSTCS